MAKFKLHINDKIKTVLEIMVTLISSVFLGLILLIMAYRLPIDNINLHLQESVSVFEREGTYPELVGWCTSNLDNWTDAIMLLSAGYSGNETVLEKALTVFTERSVDKDPVESFKEYYSENKNSFIEPYPRYWHGYLIFLKPLLSIMSYDEIRIINHYFQMFIAVILLLILQKKRYNEYIIPVLLLLGSLPFLSTAYSLQYSSVYYVAMIGTIILLLKYSEWQDSGKIFIFFLILGSVTNYFDLLTYPLFTFGIPICFYFCMKQGNKLIYFLKDLATYGFSWFLGYGGMWMGKWIAATVLTEKNVIRDAITRVGYRTSSVTDGGEQVEVLEVLFCNFKAFVKNPTIILIILFCFIKLFQMMKCNKVNSANRGNLIFVFIGCLPMIWYIATPNHSMTHWWIFTYKELTITAFSLMCFLTKSGSRRGENVRA